ncbi:hypothetical protein DL763_006270 [Monosporascus cannonballus]|nr:hypothetical protein DL763_006270 [Monosporascus cannonballus]
MDANKPTALNPFKASSTDLAQRDDWEDWEDEDTDTGVHTNDLLVDLYDEGTKKPCKSTPALANRANTQQNRSSVQRPMRIKSKGRQKAQIAKAGIKLDTDVSRFHRAALQQQQARPADHGAHDEIKTKFVDNAALLALEGEPTSASVGSFSWLKQKPGNLRGDKSAKVSQYTSSDLSPAARPIVIGIAVPSDELSGRQVSPQAAVVETPIGMGGYPLRQATQAGHAQFLSPQQQRSVWSPDTEATESPYSAHHASGGYSPSTMFGGATKSVDAPPVPTLPATLKFKQSAGTTDVDDDDAGTPCTLFEEDGSPLAIRKSYVSRGAAISPDSAATSQSHGWWDHITTPFAQSNPFKQQAQEMGASSSASPQEWWRGVDEKRAKPTRSSGLTIATPVFIEQQRTSQSAVASSSNAPSTQSESHAEKARILQQENDAPSEEPPPYSPPKETHQVKYQAIFPTSHASSSQEIPSPGPVTPGLSGTMSSQGGIKMADIPLTPSGLRTMPQAVLPDRPAGSYVTGDHFYEAPGRANRLERQRRRHEKEDVIARKAGGFWRGRGCVSSDGCFGRTGREGRQRRRICLGILGGIIAAIILAVVLAVVLTRKALAGPAESAEPAEQTPETSIWLNITDFPPIPTGVLTVAGPENVQAVSGCVIENSETAWSCSLPKEEQGSVAPYLPNQPEFIFQIQYDNDSRALWNVSEAIGQPEPADSEDSKKERGRRRLITAPGISPDPEPPSVAEMVFLGNTTDKVKADKKAGEPTPFYISLLLTVDETVGPNTLGRRQGFNNAIGGSKKNGTANSGLADILPPPVSNPDGTAAPARLFPLVKQQPLRLYDRGLESEHYGFYTYFDKRTYLTDKDDAVSADKEGGSRLSEARYVVTFTETRFLVKMWTRRENTTQLLGDGAVPGTTEDGAPSVSSRPGTMPYPVIIAEDMHGGNPTKKMTFYYGVDRDQQVNATEARLVTVDKGFGGTIVNEMAKADLALGGVDGGTGGCRCEWQNFRG